MFTFLPHKTSGWFLDLLAQRMWLQSCLLFALLFVLIHSAVNALQKLQDFLIGSMQPVESAILVAGAGLLP